MYEASLHTDILILLFQLFFTSFCASIWRIISTDGQPSVVGEILAGLFWSVTPYGVIPIFSDLMIVQSTNPEQIILQVVSLLGAMLLLFITGLETDLALIKHHSKKCYLELLLRGLILPLIFGFAFCFLIPGYLSS